MAHPPWSPCDPRANGVVEAAADRAPRSRRARRDRSSARHARRATLADIAAAVGVSQATASRSLRGDERISEPTRRAVRQAAERLQYVPNAAARSLAVRRSRTLGLLVADFGDPFHGQVATGFEAVAASAGYAAIIVPGSEIAEGRGASDPRSSSNTGPKASRSRPESSTPEEAQRLASPQPLVFVHPEYRGLLSRGWVPPDGTIRFDDIGAVAEAVRYLLDQGYRDVAYIGSGRWPSQVLRQRSASRALREAGMRPLRTFSVASDAWRMPGSVGDVLIGGPLPEAVLCYDDTLALALIHDLQVGGHRACLTTSRSWDSTGSRSPRSRIRASRRSRLPIVETGRLAASSLVEAIDTGRLPPAKVVPTMLVVRESTRPVARAAMSLAAAATSVVPGA